MHSWLEKAYQAYQKIKAQGRLSHALLICGSSGLGTNELTYEIARDYLCSQGGDAHCTCHSCEMFRASTHPDFYVLKKEGRSIGVDSLRGATSMLEGTATNANGKVLLIEDAEFMTVQASNALLKTLEEPPPNSFIMLSTGSPKSLLPTILSRTMKLTITTPSLSELNVFLNKELNTTNDYTLELLVSGLNPLQALEFIQGEDGKKLKDAVKAFNDVILRNALPSYFVQMVDKKLSPELTFALLFEVLKEAMRFQVGAYKKEESILQDKQVLQIIARIDPACLAQGLKKIMDLKKVPGLKVSMVNNLQLLTFMELLRGDEAYID